MGSKDDGIAPNRSLPEARGAMKDTPPEALSKLVARLSLRAVPWLTVAVMATLWPRRKAQTISAARCQTPDDFDAVEPGRGRTARAPWQIPPLGWKDILWRTYMGSMMDRLPALAGGVTFYILLATFPAIAAFVSVYGMFLDVHGVEQRLAQLSEVFPQDAVELIRGQMLRLASQKHGTLGAALAVSTLVSIWSANAGIKSLFDGLNIVYQEEEKRYYLQRSFTTYLATFAGILFFSGIAGLTVAAPVVLHTFGVNSVRIWLGPVRWLLVYGLAAAVFTLAYRYGPSRVPARWRWVIMGGLSAAALWMVGSLAFSWYVSNFTHFGVTYGSLGAMIAYMLWIWVSVWIVLVGAELNAQIEHQTAQDSTRGSAAPLGERGAVVADSVGKAFTVSWVEAWEISRDFLQRQVDYSIDTVRAVFRR